jgi:GDP-L-fucose synthase
VYSKNCDLTQQASLNQYNACSYDYIYHLAAWTQAGDFCLYHPGEQWMINQQINTNVLTWWQKHQPQAKLICIGTSCAYDPGVALVEENYLVGTPIDSLFTYAMTKRMLYAGLLALHKQFGLTYLYLVPSTLYGPGYHTDGRQMHFIFDLIRKILRGKLYGDSVILWGHGYQQRELVFVDDFVHTMLQLTATCDDDIINIGAGEEYSIRRFAELICAHVGYDFNTIQFDTTRYVGAESKCLKVSKLRTLLPELTLTPLDVGLAKTIAWFWSEREKLVAASN